MKSAAYLSGGLIICGILILVLFFKVVDLENRVSTFGEPGGVAALQESLKRLQAEVAVAKELAPGLGEYMTNSVARGKTVVCCQSG
jgi:hypothetical protein